MKIAQDSKKKYLGLDNIAESLICLVSTYMKGPYVKTRFFDPTFLISERVLYFKKRQAFFASLTFATWKMSLNLNKDSEEKYF